MIDQGSAAHQDTRKSRLTTKQKLTWCAHLFKACFRQHHRELVPVLSRLIPDDGMVIDVGGHAGQFAKLFAGLAPRGRIFTIEPSRYALSILRPALRLNRLDNVTILAVGVGDRPGTMTLSTPIKRSGSLGFGLASLGRDDRPSHQQAIEVTTIDEIVRRRSLDRLDFIKADIEGWELRAMIGARETLARFHPTLLLEVSEAHLRRAGDDAGALFAFLGQLGYAPSVVGGDDGARLVPVAAAEDGDIFFVAGAQPGP